MSESYRYDDPLGIHGWRSKKMLGGLILEEFERYEHSFRTEDARLLSASNHGLEDPLVGEHRLSTLVPKNDITGYALVATQSENPNHRGIEGILYSVDLSNDPQVTESNNIFITASSLLKREVARQAEVKDLASRFDKTQLEAILRLTGKMVVGFAYQEALPENEGPTPDAYYTAKAMSDSLRRRDKINRAIAVEPRVLRALQHFNLDHLSLLFPSSIKAEGSKIKPPIVKPYQVDQTETLHIFEWGEFTEAAASRLRRETDKTSLHTAVALQHITDEEHYVARIQAQAGTLTKIQVLRQAGSKDWESQEFDLRPDNDDDDLERLQINPAWNKEALLEAIQQGRPVTNEFYKGYLLLAAMSPDSNIPLAEVVDLTIVKKKKRAA